MSGSGRKSTLETLGLAPGSRVTARAMREALMADGNKILDALREMAFGLHVEELDADGNLCVVFKKPAKDERTRFLAAKTLGEMLWGKPRQTVEVATGTPGNLADLLDAEDRALLNQDLDRELAEAEAVAAIRRGDIH